MSLVFRMRFVSVRYFRRQAPCCGSCEPKLVWVEEALLGMFVFVCAIIRKTTCSSSREGSAALLNFCCGGSVECKCNKSTVSCVSVLGCAAEQNRRQRQQIHSVSLQPHQELPENSLLFHLLLKTDVSFLTPKSLHSCSICLLSRIWFWAALSPDSWPQGLGAAASQSSTESRRFMTEACFHQRVKVNWAEWLGGLGRWILD